MLTGQYYIKYQTTLEKSNKLHSMFLLLRRFHIGLDRGSTRCWLSERVLAPWQFSPHFTGQVTYSNEHVLVRIEMRGAIVELAPKFKMALGFWSCCQT